MKSLKGNFFCIIAKFILDVILIFSAHNVTFANHKKNYIRLEQDLLNYLPSHEAGVVKGNVYLNSLTDSTANWAIKLNVHDSINFLVFNDLMFILNDKNPEVLKLHILSEFNSSSDHGKSDSMEKLRIEIKNKIKFHVVIESTMGIERQAYNIQVIARTLFMGLQFNLLDKEYVRINIKHLLQKLPPRDWVKPNGVTPGTAFILRVLLILKKENYCCDYLSDQIEIIREQLLRRFEIKLESIINFSGYQYKKSLKLVEHIHNIISILEISIIYRDVRFLNAGLKAIDRLIPIINKIKLNEDNTPKNLFRILIAVQYIQIYNRQEEAFELLCQL